MQNWHANLTGRDCWTKNALCTSLKTSRFYVHNYKSFSCINNCDKSFFKLNIWLHFLLHNNNLFWLVFDRFWRNTLWRWINFDEHRSTARCLSLINAKTKSCMRNLVWYLLPEVECSISLSKTIARHYTQSRLFKQL